MCLKLGYRALVEEELEGQHAWLWRIIWKLKCPSIFFMWFILNNKAPTWEVLQKNNFHGQGWCNLCKQADETIQHLIMLCYFTKEVWKEAEGMIGLKNAWEGGYDMGYRRSLKILFLLEGYK
jgi:hypothetical protein